MKFFWKLLGLIPLFKNLRAYNTEKFAADLRAGLNVALLDFPQGMAYALIAGFPVQFGIYASALGSVTGPLFASSRYIMLGPTNATAVLILSSFLTLHLDTQEKIIFFPVLILMVAVFMLIGALLQLHVIVRYVSRTVVTGYVTAAAFLIIVNQLEYILGVEVPRSATFGDTVWLLLEHVQETHLGILMFSLGTISFYLLIQKLCPKLPHVAVTLIVASASAPFLQDYLPLQYLPSVPIGEWPFALPQLSFDAVSKLSSAAFAIAFLSLVESSSIAKTLAAQSGDQVNIRQQMLSMSVANFANSVGSGMPVSGSLTRSALNYSSGAKTPVSSIVSGLVLILGVLFLGPWIGLIPKPALAALVILVGFRLIKPKQAFRVMGTTRSDAGVFMITFLSGLFFPLDTAIYVGVMISIFLFLKKVSSPSLEEHSLGDAEKKNPAEGVISIIHVEDDLFFGSTDVFLEQMRQIVSRPNLMVLILRLRNAKHMDASSALAIEDLIEFATRNQRSVLIAGVQPELGKIISRSGIMDKIGMHNLFKEDPDNPNISTRNALKRAQEITGLQHADITIFAKKKNTD